MAWAAREATVEPWGLDTSSDASARAERRTVADLLADAATLDEGATGAIAMGAPDRLDGMVLLEGGRVCWSTTAGMGDRLRALVTEASSEVDARARVGEVFRVCVRDRAPLGEALIKSGLATPKSLRAAFVRQTAEALHVLASGGARPLGWIPRHTHPYHASFTFSVAELLVSAAAIGAAHAGAAAEEDLLEVLDQDARGLSFTRPPRHAQPTLVATKGAVELNVAETLAVGRWASDAVSCAALLARGVRFVSAALDRRTALVAWSGLGLVHVAICTEPTSVAWVISRLEGAHAATSRRATSL